MRAELVESIRAAIAEAQRQADATGREVVLVAVSPAEESAKELSGFDRPWKTEFIEHLRAGRAVRIAAELAGVSARHAYRCRSEDPRFAAAWCATRGYHSCHSRKKTDLNQKAL